MTNANFFNQTRSFSNRNVRLVACLPVWTRDYERESAAAAVRGGAKSELLSLILFMPLTAWKERRRITCQLGCSDPFCDLTSPLTTTVCHRRYFRAKESARQKRENGKIEYKEKWPRAVCKVVGLAVGGVSMKEPRAALFLSFFSVCVGEIIKIRQKSRERKRERARLWR